MRGAEFSGRVWIRGARAQQLAPLTKSWLRRAWLAGALAVAGAVTQAGAQQNCDQPRGSFDQVYCQMKVLVQADAELNTTYQQLLARLPTSARQVLRQTQRAWMVRRDRECVAYDARLGDVVYTGCAVTVTTERLNVLRDRLRECQTSGCQPSKFR